MGATHIEDAEAVLRLLRETFGFLQIQLAAEVTPVLPAIEFATREHTVTICQRWVAREKNAYERTERVDWSENGGYKCNPCESELYLLWFSTKESLKAL